MKKIMGIFVLLVVLVIATAILNPQFVSAYNLKNTFRWTGLYGILAIGVMFVIITGGIDLSIGSLIGLTGCLLAMFLEVSIAPSALYPLADVDEEKQLVWIAGDQTAAVAEGASITLTEGRVVQEATIYHVTQSQFDAQRGATSIAVDATFKADQAPGPLGVITYFPVVDKHVDETDPKDRKITQLMLDGDQTGVFSFRDRGVMRESNGKHGSLIIVEADTYDPQTNRTTLHLAKTLSPSTVVDTIGHLKRRHMNILLAVVLVMLIALALGLAHGLLITKLRLQPFIVTLCGLLIYRGMARGLTGDTTLGFFEEYDSLRQLAKGEPIHVPIPGIGDVQVPMPFLLFIGTAIVAAVFLNLTIWGRYLLALGRNETAARFSGINTDAVTILAYVICAGLAGVGGILFAVDINSIQPASHGNFYELFAIAAAVLGGCSLRGGEGSVLGVVIGMAILRVLYNSINVLGINPRIEFAVIGAVILVGVIVDELVKRFAARRRAVREAALAAGGG